MSRSKPTLEGFAIPRAQKGEARSAVSPAPDEERQEPIAEPVRSQPFTETVQISMAGVLEQMAPLEVETRTTVSVRLTLALQERLRLFCFQSRRNKQDVIEQALHEFLAGQGR